MDMETGQAPSPSQIDDQLVLGPQDEQQQPGTPAVTSKRYSYVARACLHCQKRKTKCSGEQPCLKCFNSGHECVYNTGRFRRRRRNNAAQQAEATEYQAPNPAPTESAESNVDAVSYNAIDQPMHDNKLQWILDLSARMTRLEQKLNQTTARSNQSNDSTFFASDEGFTDIDHVSPNFQGGTDLLNPISTLDRIVGPSEVESTVPTPQINQRPEAGGRFNDCRSFPHCCIEDLRLWSNATRSQDEENLRASFRTFFNCLNPHYLCINEPYFISRFELYLSDDNVPSNTTDSYQFVALISLVVAVVKILEEYCVDSKAIPGWREFNRAEHLLSHTTWLGRGNLLTIQCLILKTIYFMFIERQNAAYDAISTAVRLTYQIGLHDQTSWHNSSLFDATMRQRIFWCLYCLDRNVALVCGVPFLIRESDFKVDLPHSLEETSIMVNQSTPDPESLSIPYIHRTIKWAKLCSEIWDAMFGTNASNLTSQEFVATMDARIVLLVHDLPPQLQWTPTYLESAENQRNPLYVLRQAMVIHLRTNHLRLLLRRKEMVNLKYNPRDATACVAITASSIDAIHSFHTSRFHQRTDRYSSVMFLAGAIIPLTCIIIRDGNDIDDDLRVLAVRAFHKALSLLQDISPGHTFAKRMLTRLKRIVDAAKTKILNQGLIGEIDGAFQNDLSPGYTINHPGGAQYQSNESPGAILNGAFSGAVWNEDQFWPAFEMESFDPMFGK